MVLLDTPFELIINCDLKLGSTLIENKNISEKLMELLVLFGILTLASAVCARLIRTNRQHWFGAYGIIAFIFFMGLLLNFQTFIRSLVVLIVISAIGFLGPEIWAATQNVTRSSRVIGISVLVMLVSLLALVFPEITAQIVSLGIIFGVLWLIIAPIFRSNRQCR